MAGIDQSRQFVPLKIAVLTVSDTREASEDKSGATLIERIRAAGAGIGAFYTPTAYGTRLAEGKETRRIGDRDYVLEYPIHADYALIKADRADRWGNLTYRKSARNFGPIMAAACGTSLPPATTVYSASCASIRGYAAASKASRLALRCSR